MPETNSTALSMPIRPGIMTGNMEAALRKTITPQ